MLRMFLKADLMTVGPMKKMMRVGVMRIQLTLTNLIMMRKVLGKEIKMKILMSKFKINKKSISTTNKVNKTMTNSSKWLDTSLNTMREIISE